jgi:sugar/nucleoside kinase (ribokinase family)
MIFNHYFCDLIVTGLPDIPRLGKDLFGNGMGIHAGGTFNTVRAMHRLGMRIGWTCDFGSDLFSQFVLSEIQKESVDTCLLRIHDHPVRSFSLAFSFEEDRGFISYMDPLPPVDRVPYVLEHNPKAVFLCSLEYGPETLALIDAAHRVGAVVGMDCQTTSDTIETPQVIEALQAVDIFMPNAQESLQFTGAEDVETAAKILAKFTPLVVIKIGSVGALAQTGDCQVFSPAVKFPVVDTTGAGDCFNAGFMYSHLQGRPLEESLRAGHFCGGLSTTAHGTIATPTREALEAFLSTQVGK